MTNNWDDITTKVLVMLGFGEDANVHGKRRACPFCSTQDKTAMSFTRNNGQLGFNCFACGMHGNIIQLYAAMTKQLSREDLEGSYAKGTSLYKEAMGDMMRAIGENRQLDTVRYSAPAPEYQSQALARPEELDETYSSLLKMLTLSDEHREHLLHVRGLTQEDIFRNGYKTWPQSGHSEIAKKLRNEQCCELNGVPGFFRDTAWKLVYRRPGFAIPIRSFASGMDTSSRGRICGMQIRRDGTGNGPRYSFLSSNGKPNGTKAASEPHIAGTGRMEYSCWLTEGCLKGDIIQSLTDKFVLALQGVLALGLLPEKLAQMKNAGVGHVYIAYDMDSLTNKNVEDARNRLKKFLAENGMAYTDVYWNPAYKGLDDFLLAKYKEQGGEFGGEVRRQIMELNVREDGRLTAQIRER